MKGEKLVGWKVVLSLSVLSVVLILFATVMKIQLNFLTAEIANLGKFLMWKVYFTTGLEFMTRSIHFGRKIMVDENY